MKLCDGSITAAFERVGKDKVTYSHRQHTRKESQAEIAWWVSESMRPFSIVDDCGFQSLMKTGWIYANKSSISSLNVSGIASAGLKEQTW